MGGADRELSCGEVMSKAGTNGHGHKNGKKKLSPKQEKFVEGLLRHGNGTKAAIEAGYSPKRARITASELTGTNRNIRERINARISESKVETNEIIGTLASQMRGSIADIVPEDELLKAAKDNGVDHLIKKLKVHTRFIPQKGHDEDGNPMPSIREVTHEFEMYSAQEAAKQLAAIKGIVKEPAKNPLDLAREAIAEFLTKHPKTRPEAVIPIYAQQFGVDESELVSEAVN